jgi:hypothetical protein
MTRSAFWVYVAVSFLLCLGILPSEGDCTSRAARKAALVDQLSLSWPNPTFVAQSTTILKHAGYDLDYYEGNVVTVDFFRTLPEKGYQLIILRVHSAYMDKYRSLAMFTSEPYDKHRYVYEQLRNRVALGYTQPHSEGDPKYLTITDKFIRFSMKGKFNDTTIIMMGCTGIAKRCAANAFLAKGAIAYIGWDGLVSAHHTDRATIRLLNHLLSKKQPIAGAVGQTMEEVGQDPQYDSALLFWPIQAGSHVVNTSIQ